MVAYHVLEPQECVTASTRRSGYCAVRWPDAFLHAHLFLPWLPLDTASSIITTTRSLSVWPLVPLPGTSRTGSKAPATETRKEQVVNTRVVDSAHVGVAGAVFNVAFRYVISHDVRGR